ncbi:uncharacterized protein AB675_10019 [Cyphellophora attinorum]|uniref:Protein MON2-like protein n=1 Tax=Cyphellophora attinorum TaxID=1664694 RepID=A0A0N1GZU6_9EURO|nr:uncharacterized protein AB675_10019 [Phialophora attinorum]KPI36726.1 hypothetical protein AB675_10019 [Phialophora attinorum]
MTSSFLQSELTSLISDSKRKFSDVRTAAEKSLGDLKAITVTSETQLAADLSRKPGFIDCFLLACQTKNAKLANSATNCLQRLIASRAVAPDRLEDVLGALKDVVNTSYDVQLKILQTLPALLQLYSPQIHGDLLARSLEICAVLQSSKTPLVSSSAGATLWQLISSVFDQAAQHSANGTQDAHDAEAGDGKNAPADDAARLFHDLCVSLNDKEPSFIEVDTLAPSYLVETLIKVIDENSAYIKSRPPLIAACQDELIPAITNLLESVDDAQALTPLLRLSNLLLQKLAPMVFAGMKPVFILLLKFTDREHPPWKRSLALEFFTRLFANFGLIARLFDESKDDGDNVVVKALGTFVRISSEDPVLIGLGRQSTMPAQRGSEAQEDDMAAIEAQGASGLASVSSADATATGISLEFSTLETPLLDTSDPSKAGTIPKTYNHTLILDSISAFCDGLSKFIMPLSVLSRTQEDQEDEPEAENGRRSQSVTRAASGRKQIQRNKYQRLINPLKIKDLPQLPQVQACSKMAESCWPAILAMCSTFLNAALDSHFYHVLIRSIQKLAQVSGTLDLSTPRDALLTSLAKGSIPANTASFLQLASPAMRRKPSIDQQEPSTPIKSPPLDSSRQSLDTPRQTLNVRHLLCLRALLNLGIALGPSLAQDSWFIIIETLQQAEALIAVASAGRVSQNGSHEGQTTITSEIAAVNGAAKKMMESTRSYPDAAFGIVVGAILRLMGDDSQSNGVSKSESMLSPAPASSPGGLASPTMAKHGHKVSRSVSGIWVKTKALDVEIAFALQKLRDLSRLNLHRFVALESQEVTWDLIVARLLKASQSDDIHNSLRQQAASTVDSIAMEAIKLIKADESEEAEVDTVQCLCLQSLADQLEDSVTTDDELTTEIIKLVFEALEDILGHSGESLRQGWTIVFQILRKSFPSVTDQEHAEGLSPSTPVAFRCVQLVCTDFVELLQLESLKLLLSLLYMFGSQQYDTNMALTTTGLLRNIAALLQHRTDVLDVSETDIHNEDNDQGKESTPVQLWCASLDELAKMCSDTRKDVRDASIRILLQTMDSASSQLTPMAWNVLIDAIPIAILQDYQAALNQEGIDREHLSASASHLTQGLTDLIVENMAAIVRDENFADTWSRLHDIFNVTLEGGQLSTISLVYTCISRLLQATDVLDMDHSSLIEPMLMLWAWHPVPEQHNDSADVSNQAALSAHLHVLRQAYTTCPAAVQSFAHRKKSISDYATSAVRESLLKAVHPPYTNDVKVMTSEQQEAASCLDIIRALFSNELDNFCGFVLELIEEMLDIKEGSLVPRPEQSAVSKKSQKPTYIAVASHCIDLLRGVAEEVKGRKDYAAIVQLPYALDMLSAIIKTKYTPIPTNAAGPIWRNATVTAVVVLEGSLSSLGGFDGITDVARYIIATATAILGSDGLQISKSPAADTLRADEAFDSEHFLRFHHAAIPIIAQSGVSAQANEYILTLFRSSLLYTPRDGEQPPDLLGKPLQAFEYRVISQDPKPFPRQTIASTTALSALFDLLSPNSPHYRPSLAVEAAPYVLLRIALPLKSFNANQKIRGLTPLPAFMQAELVRVLSLALELRVDDGTVRRGVEAVTIAADADSRSRTENDTSTSGGGGDGKEHLRKLYSLILKTQNEWRRTIRLPVAGQGWMDREGGRGKAIEELMERWVRVVSEGWGIP